MFLRDLIYKLGKLVKLTNFKAESASSSSPNFQAAASLSISRTFINVTESCIRGIARYRSQARNRCPFNTRLPCCALKSPIPSKCMKARDAVKPFSDHVYPFGRLIRSSLCKRQISGSNRPSTDHYVLSLNAFPKGGLKMKTSRRRCESSEDANGRINRCRRRGTWKFARLSPSNDVTNVLRDKSFARHRQMRKRPNAPQRWRYLHRLPSCERMNM